MKIISFDKWTRKTVNEHTHGFTQTLNYHYINIVLFGFVFKAVEWNEYINHFHNKD